MYELRPYQQVSVERTVETRGDVICVLPTGGGKSVVIAALAQHYKEQNQKVAVSVRTSALIPQLENTLVNAGLTVGVVKAGYHYQPKRDVTLIMEQTFSSRYRGLELSSDILIKDEVHIGYTGEEFELLKTVLKPTKVIGLTATPLTADGLTLNPDIPIVEEIDTQGLIEQGYLTAPNYRIPKHSELVDYSSALNGNDYSTVGLDLVLNTPEHNRFVVEQTLKHAIANNRKCMVFGNSIAHVEALSQAFTDAGVANVFTHSEMPSQQAQEAIETYKTNQVGVIINCSQLTTGFDHPPTDCVVLVRPTKVLRLYLQIVGRGLRIADGKEDCLVLDLAQCVTTHGFVEGVRNFHCITRDEVRREQQEHTALPLPSTLVEVLDKERVIEYRAMNLTATIDDLREQVELLNAENDRLSRELTQAKSSLTYGASIEDREAMYLVAQQALADSLGLNTSPAPNTTPNKKPRNNVSRVKRERTKQQELQTKKQNLTDKLNSFMEELSRLCENNPVGLVELDTVMTATSIFTRGEFNKNQPAILQAAELAGFKPFYDEDDKPRPLGIYNLTMKRAFVQTPKAQEILGEDTTKINGQTIFRKLSTENGLYTVHNGVVESTARCAKYVITLDQLTRQHDAIHM